MENDQFWIINNPAILEKIGNKYGPQFSVSGNFHALIIVGTEAKASLKIAKSIEIPRL